MGGEPWFYLVDYEPDIDSALQKLRQREFKAGRYNPVVWFITTCLSYLKEVKEFT